MPFLILMQVLLFAVSTQVGAQTTMTSLDRWQKLPGNARDLSSNAEGQSYVTGLDGGVWRWDRQESRWRKMSGLFDRITAAEGNRPWAVNLEGDVYRYNGLWWEDKAQNAQDVSADTHGNTYVLHNNGELKKWYALRNEWREVEQPTELLQQDRFRSITMGDDETLWAITWRNRIFYLKDDQWRLHPGLATALAVGANIRALVDLNGRVRIWNGQERLWGVVSGIEQVQDLAITADNFIWVLLRNSEIWANGGVQSAEQDREKEEDAAQGLTPSGLQAPQIFAQSMSAELSVAPFLEASEVVPVQRVQSEDSAGSFENPLNDDPVTRSNKDPITFVNTQNSALEIAIGGEGSVFGLDVAGNILRWSNVRKSFESFPGRLSRIAVDKDGKPWGISALGRIFFHNGRNWKQVLNATASDIAIGYEGSVVIASAAGELFKLSNDGKRFLRVKGEGVKVAVQSDGTLWTIRSDFFIQHCNVFPCTIYPQRAREIAAGPDGSIWIVSEQNRLMRLAKGAATFKVVETPGHVPAKVSVGPNGYPWVIGEKKTVLASTFFDRDESADKLVAATTTPGSTTGTGETGSVTSPTSGFTFSKNMSFETVRFSALVAGSCPSFASDPEGIIWVHNGTFGQVINGVVEQYNPRQRKFSQVVTGFESRDVKSFDVGKYGEIWAITDFPQFGVFRSENKVLKQYPIAGASDYHDVATSVDGTVYVIATVSGTRYIYSKAVNSNVFERFSSYADASQIGVGIGGDIWIIGDNNQIMRWDGARFIEPGKTTFLVGKLGTSKVNGEVYVVKRNTADLYKWNATNKSFDKVAKISVDTFGVDGGGRPWICNDTTPVIKRARG